MGATYLPKVWEEMTAAYEYGVPREIWVTNIGDIRHAGVRGFPTSWTWLMILTSGAGRMLPLPPSTPRRGCAVTFGAAFAPADLPRIEGIITDYTRLLARRKREKMGANSYHPTHYGEAEEVQAKFLSVIAYRM